MIQWKQYDSQMLLWEIMDVFLLLLLNFHLWLSYYLLSLFHFSRTFLSWEKVLCFYDKSDPKVLFLLPGFCCFLPSHVSGFFPIASNIDQVCSFVLSLPRFQRRLWLSKIISDRNLHKKNSDLQSLTGY